MSGPAFRLYWEVLRTTARRMSTYRGATFAGVFTNTVFGFLIASILRAVFEQTGTIGAFDTTDAVTFTFLAQGLAMPVGMFGYTEMAERIHTGEVAMDLCRPYDYQGWWAAAAVGRASFYSWARGIPPFLAGALVFDLRLPDARVDLAGVRAGVGAGRRARLRLGLPGPADRVLDHRRARARTSSGGSRPGSSRGCSSTIVLFPAGLEAVARALPVRRRWCSCRPRCSSASTRARPPAGVRLPGAWLAALLAVGRAVLARAVRKLVVLGG